MAIGIVSNAGVSSKDSSETKAYSRFNVESSLVRRPFDVPWPPTSSSCPAKSNGTLASPVRRRLRLCQSYQRDSRIHPIPLCLVPIFAKVPVTPPTVHLHSPVPLDPFSPVSPSSYVPTLRPRVNTYGPKVTPWVAPTPTGSRISPYGYSSGELYTEYGWRDGVLCFRGRYYVPDDDRLEQTILREAHSSPYAMHPGGDKNSILIKRINLGLLQPIRIPEWKWDRITMDFVTGLPLTPSKNDSVWVIVDRLTKSAHFIPVRSNYTVDKLAKLYISEIVKLHAVPLSIISDRDPKLTSQFWQALHDALGTNLNFSTTFHP
ncbi:hypothetical protein V6N13_061866 [Hibiscus sabdariffa]